MSGKASNINAKDNASKTNSVHQSHYRDVLSPTNRVVTAYIHDCDKKISSRNVVPKAEIIKMQEPKDK